MTINPYESPRSLFIPPPADDGDPTLLKFDLELEDLLNFLQFHHRHSSTVKIQRYLAIGLVFLATFFVLFQIIDAEDQLQGLVVVVVGTLVAVFLMDLFFKWSLRAQSRSLLNEGDNSSLFGERELRLTERGLYETTEFNQSRFPYSRILRIAENPDYVFIYISSIQAHVIPKKKLHSGNLEGFMTSLRNYMQQA